ncbi:hypothetical protein N7494_005444 [Penicillium frequentans]|uniref:Actin-like ATPase domain-containing protein n=1 Tax=Penicillium frequentans TaxID=3151616 RepID=A0AAD6CY24_9EURO|nr:hypothetical protein N7494_005444 [Penicillium glabrum]
MAPARRICRVGLDFGTSTITVAFTVVGTEQRRLVKFNSSKTQKTNEELPAEVAVNQVGDQLQWFFGHDGRNIAGSVHFENIKLAVIGEEPYRGLLARAFEKARTKFKVKGESVILFQRIFEYIFHTILDQLIADSRSWQDQRILGHDDVDLHCYVTYPVRDNDALRLVLVDAAQKAGCSRVGGVSEPLAAAYFMIHHAKYDFAREHDLSWKPEPQNAKRTMLIVDMGGGSTDAALVCVNDAGGVELVCPTNGVSRGGESVNKSARSWFKREYARDQTLKDNPQWALLATADDDRWAKISARFSECKVTFDGLSPVVFDVLDQSFIIEPHIMEQFFTELIDDVRRLIKSQLRLAKKRGSRPGHFVLCGGPARNPWLRAIIFAVARELEPQLTCVAETEVGTVAWGALSFAENPIEEDSVAKENIGFQYLDTVSPSGNTCAVGREKAGIAWQIEKVSDEPNKRKEYNAHNHQGQPAGSSRHVELFQFVYRDRSDPPNTIISSEVYRTTPGFDSSKIRENEDDDLEFDCRITYPINGLRSTLRWLGTVEAPIPHAEIFPPGSSHDWAGAYFVFSMKVQEQLLVAQVSFKRLDGTLLHLLETFIPAACSISQSELDLDHQHQQPHLIPFPLSRIIPSRKRTRKRASPSKNPGEIENDGNAPTARDHTSQVPTHDLPILPSFASPANKHATFSSITAGNAKRISEDVVPLPTPIRTVRPRHGRSKRVLRDPRTDNRA